MGKANFFLPLFESKKKLRWKTNVWSVSPCSFSLLFCHSLFPPIPNNSLLRKRYKYFGEYLCPLKQFFRFYMSLMVESGIQARSHQRSSFVFSTRRDSPTNAAGKKSKSFLLLLFCVGKGKSQRRSSAITPRPPPPPPFPPPPRFSSSFSLIPRFRLTLGATTNQQPPAL